MEGGTLRSSPVLRGLARAATVLADHPAALRVLCIATEHMDVDATCSVSQGSIAERLKISRQAVNKHFGLLGRTNILISEIGKAGVLKRYCLSVGEPCDGN